VSLRKPEGGHTKVIDFTVGPKENFATRYEKEVCKAFRDEIDGVTKDIAEPKDRKRAVKRFIDALSTEVTWTHRHYVKDDEYIPFGEDIETFLKREIAKAIIRWADSAQLGY
jgi:type I restriction enzyme M protein